MKQIIIYLSPLFVLLASCKDEANESKVLPGEDQKVSFTLQLPAGNSSSHRSMGVADENYVETIDVFVFDITSSGNEIFAYKTTGTSIDNQNITTKTFSTSLHKSSRQQRLVLFANARDAVNKLNDISVGADKNLLMSRLRIKRTTAWNSTSSADFEAIPMWGQSEAFVIDNSSSGISGIKMLRMLARIDVNLTGQALINFNMQSAYVYNRNTEGKVVPDALNWDKSNLKVTAASIPSDATIEKGPLGPYTTQNNTFNKDIYIFETAATVEPMATTATCLIIGGIYQGDTSPTYYRVDFFKDAAKTTYRDILRNQAYLVNVTNVLSGGHRTPDEAFNSKTVNIEAEIVEWNLVDYNLTFDGQYQLTLNQNEFALTSILNSGTTLDNQLIIFTDHPQGWKVHKIVDENNLPVTWMLTNFIPGVSGEPNTQSRISILTTVNDTGVERIGYVYIQAGSLQYAIKVTQSAALPIEKTSNCYIIKPGGNTVSIPVSKANEDGIQRIGSTDAITAELVWTDNVNRIGDNSNIKNITVTGTGDTGIINITTGSASGNAVIAVKVNGIIRWSWHIWVLSEDPGAQTYTYNGNEFMDRNLGATTATRGQLSSFGLYYQWGRKDPYPGSSNLTATAPPEITIYNQTGTTSVTRVSTGASLENSIQNPLTFYYANNWYGSKGDTSWLYGSTTKSVYDPCPEGWRIPPFKGTVSPWNGLTGVSSSTYWDMASVGRIITATGDFWPGGGRRNIVGVVFDYVNLYGGYWTDRPSSGVYAYSLNFDRGTYFNTALAYERSYGLSVRCVRTPEE